VRPALVVIVLLVMLSVAPGLLLLVAHERREAMIRSSGELKLAVRLLGITDLALSTEARYTRHPAVTDPLAPFMDHPAGLEHFPSGSFFAPPSSASARNMVR